MVVIMKMMIMVEMIGNSSTSVPMSFKLKPVY